MYLRLSKFGAILYFQSCNSEVSLWQQYGKTRDENFSELTYLNFSNIIWEKCWPFKKIYSKSIVCNVNFVTTFVPFSNREIDGLFSFIKFISSLCLLCSITKQVPSLQKIIFKYSLYYMESLYGVCSNIPKQQFWWIDLIRRRLQLFPCSISPATF